MFDTSYLQVFCKLSCRFTLPELFRELQRYGEIERIVRCSKRSFKVVYRYISRTIRKVFTCDKLVAISLRFSDLTAACRAVGGLKYNMDLFCTWYHRHLQERKFLQFGKDPLKVLIYKFWLRRHVNLQISFSMNVWFVINVWWCWIVWLLLLKCRLG